MFKTRLDTFGNDFGHFWTFENFSTFWKHFEDSTFHGTLGKKKFEKNYPKTCSKHVWTLLGTNLGILGILKIFWFFENISKTRPSMEHWAKKVYEKITQKHVQNTFGHFWEGVWAFLDFWKFFDFLKTFRRLDPPWNTGQIFFSKSTPKTCSKHNWTVLGTILGSFGILKNFRFFENISKTRPSMEHWAKKFFEKVTPKTYSKHVWTFWEQFWAFLDFWKLFENISKTRPSMEHWAKKNFEKSTPKTCSKHNWTLLGTILGIFGILKFFYLLKTFRRFDPARKTGQKKFSKKVPSKLVQNTFGHFWERFWAFLDFWNFFDFKKSISKNRPSMEHWAKKNFEKITPKTCSKHVWTLLGTNLGIFGILKIFWFFKNISKTRPSMEHWAKKFFEKVTPKTCSKHVWTFWEQFWAFLDFWKLFENISKTRPSMEHWAKKNFEKSTPKTCSKHNWTLLGTILGIFGILKFFYLLKTFRRFDPARKTGQKKFSKKVPSKLVQNTFGHFWERFWAFLDFWNFFDFRKSISKNRLSTEQWAIKNFRKNYPQNIFKTQLDTFGHDFVHFWTFEKFSIFWKHFEDSTFHGTLGKKKFRKNYPQNMFKTRLDTFGNEFGHFWNFENFLIF